MRRRFICDCGYDSCRNDADSNVPVSLISSQTVVGRSFEAKIAKDVSVKGNVRIEGRNQSFWKGYVFSCQSSQIRDHSLWNLPQLI